MTSLLRRIGLKIPFLRHQLLTVDLLSELSEQLKLVQLHLEQLPHRQLEIADVMNACQSSRFNDSKRLLSFAAKVNSQNGEDGMIAEIFNRIGTTNKTFVEIGVEDGTECNTAFLVACGWHGYWVDSSDAMLETIKKHSDKLGSQVQGLRHFITAENIESIFQKTGVPKEFDLLSVDVDQNTYYLWQAIKNYKPRVVVIEYNAAVPASVGWRVQYASERTWDGSQNFGASLKSLEKLGAELGYHLVGCDFTGTNAFFVIKDLCLDRFATPFTAENHYEPLRSTRCFSLRHQPNLFDRCSESI